MFTVWLLQVLSWYLPAWLVGILLLDTWIWDRNASWCWCWLDRLWLQFHNATFFWPADMSCVVTVQWHFLARLVGILLLDTWLQDHIVSWCWCWLLNCLLWQSHNATCYWPVNMSYVVTVLHSSLGSEAWSFGCDRSHNATCSWPVNMSCVVTVPQN